MGSRPSTLPLIVSRSMRQHGLSTTITVLAVSLASGLVMAVLAIHSATSRAFGGMDHGYDAILGPAGSQSQLVLNTLFHLDASPGNIPWSLYQKVKADPGIERAVPYAVGDNFRGYRVIGTTLDAFTGRSYVEPGEPFDPTRRQAVVGASVAREAGLARGSTFRPSHGLTYSERDPRQHAERYVVSGVLTPTGTPDDRVIFIPIEGVYRMGGHELRGSGDAIDAEEFRGAEIPDEHKEVSAVLLRFRRGGVSPGLRLNRVFNVLDPRVSMAWPIAQVMADLYQKLFWAIEVLRTLAGIVVVVAGAGLLASLYNTMNERRHELGILRALGARRTTVFGAVVGEAVAIAALGAALGFGVYAAIVHRVAGTLLSSTGVVLDVGELGAGLLWVPLGTLALGAVAGVIPALKAYSTDPGRTLGQTP